MKLLIIAAAKMYLTQSTFPTINEFPSRQIMNGASAGVDALALIQLIEPSYLETQPPDFWMRWIPSLIGDGRAGDDKEPAIAALLRLAANVAPAEMNARLLEQIQFENAGEQRFLFCSMAVDRAWSEALGTALLERLRQDILVPSIQGVILSKLIQHNVVGARQWAEETVRSEYKSERGLALATALVNANDDASWNVLWPLIQEDAEFGRELLEGVSYGSLEKSSFIAKFSDQQLGELYGWLLEQYPPGSDRRAS